ncbi:MAG: Phosphoserine aminotransferase [Alphaproteobacteria bacterium MarineAlpha5_Bin11]|nr:MAG: Phosphoserine aminotransferase [Alphaproteobacteria bacterium MarineAlpha5_Bin11]
MIPSKPINKPSNPNFSSGPCAKRPGWNLKALSDSNIGRSHRSSECKNKKNDIIIKSKEILNLPDSYLLGIMPASDTGALESALWSLLGKRNVDILAWENFGQDWVKDVVDQLKINNVNTHLAKYGDISNLNSVNFDNDVIFTWNGTTSGVCVPNAEWIPNNRQGLTICDATSAIFAMEMDFNKLDVITWSWQKVLGGEAAHGMLALSPRAVSRLEEYSPKWPIPKIFRLTNDKKLIKGIFEGSTINTPSMLCVEDALDTLNWVKSIGGNAELIKRSKNNLHIVTEWVNKSNWIEFLNQDKNTRSSTSITLRIKDEWFNNFNENEQRNKIKDMLKILQNEKVAFDINGYNKAPPSLRLWGGATIENENMKLLLPWLDWSYNKIKNNV